MSGKFLFNRGFAKSESANTFNVINVDNLTFLPCAFIVCLHEICLMLAQFDRCNIYT